MACQELPYPAKVELCRLLLTPLAKLNNIILRFPCSLFVVFSLLAVPVFSTSNDTVHFERPFCKRHLLFFVIATQVVGSNNYDRLV